MAQTAKTDKRTDAKPPNPKFQVEGGSTPFPNWLYDSEDLTGNEKLVALGYHRSAYGSDTTTTASVRGIACKTGLDKRTVKAITARLLELGLIVPKGPRKDGYAKKHDVALTKPASLEGRGRVSTTPTRGSVQHPLEGQYNTHIKSSKNIRHFPRSAGSSLSDTKEASGESIHGSAASPESAVPSEIEVSTSPDVHGNGNAAELATRPGHNGANKLLSRDADAQDEFGFGPRSESEPAPPRDDADEILDEALDPTPQKSAEPERPYNKRTINEYMLSPEGVPLDDDRDELFYEVEAVTLPSVYGEPFNPGDLDKLIADRGVSFCRMWAHWLPRKIANEYKRKPVRGVPSPTGLYAEAVRKGWKVDPSWPQFDETLHTVKAREQFEKRMAVCNAGDISRGFIPGTTYTQDDVNRFAEEVLRGECEVRNLLPNMRTPVRRKVDELEKAALEAEELPF
jgi:hypothetical protein